LGLPPAGGHTFPHEPQLLSSLDVFASHPLLSAPSQSEYPGSHVATTQVPPWHCAVAFGNAQAHEH
jgi:hypothetical protein